MKNYYYFGNSCTVQKHNGFQYVWDRQTYVPESIYFGKRGDFATKLPHFKTQIWGVSLKRAKRNVYPSSSWSPPSSSNPILAGKNSWENSNTTMSCAELSAESISGVYSLWNSIYVTENRMFSNFWWIYGVPFMVRFWQMCVSIGLPQSGLLGVLVHNCHRVCNLCASYLVCQER